MNELISTLQSVASSILDLSAWFGWPWPWPL